MTSISRIGTLLVHLFHHRNTDVHLAKRLFLVLLLQTLCLPTSDLGWIVDLFFNPLQW